jgi:hypothetical protein
MRKSLKGEPSAVELTQEQVQKLEQVFGSSWNTIHFPHGFQALQEFKAKFDHVHVPRQGKEYESLYKFLESDTSVLF